MKKLICLILSLILCHFCISCSSPSQFSPHLNTVFMSYPNNQAISFAQFKVISVSDKIFYVKSTDDEYHAYVCAKAEVVEDFYEKLNEGETVYIPLYFGTDIDAVDTSEISEWLFELDYILCHLTVAEDIFHLNEYETGELYKFNSLGANFEFYDVIPISNGKVALDKLNSLAWVKDNMFYDYSIICGFTDFIDNGMSVQEVSGNLRLLGYYYNVLNAIDLLEETDNELRVLSILEELKININKSLEELNKEV